MRFDNLLDQIWCVTPGAARWMLTRMNQLEAMGDDEIQLLFDEDEQENGGKDPVSRILSIDDGIAHIDVSGILAKDPMPSRGMFGDFAPTYGEIDEALMRARDRDVEHVIMGFSSPGGSSLGLNELAETIRLVGAEIPVTAHVDGGAASAAYWLAAQCNDVVCSPSAEVGSIGVYSVLDDVSARYEQAGVKREVVAGRPKIDGERDATGSIKGHGTPGLKISNEYRSDMQRRVDQTMDEFIEAVAEGRGMDQTAVAMLATGKVWGASDASKRGLIDRIASARDLRSQLSGDKMRDRDKPEAPIAEPQNMNDANEAKQILEDARAQMSEVHRMRAELDVDRAFGALKGVSLEAIRGARELAVALRTAELSGETKPIKLGDELVEPSSVIFGLIERYPRVEGLSTEIATEDTPKPKAVGSKFLTTDAERKAVARVLSEDEMELVEARLTN